jgi:DnaJ-class molecular chaperone
MTLTEAEEILAAHAAGVFKGRASEVAHAVLLVANRCVKCGGTGKVLYGDEEDTCGNCDGSGISSKTRMPPTPNQAKGEAR